MHKIGQEQITQYINLLSSGKSIGDVSLYQDIKQLICSKYGTNFEYLNNTIINSIDRQIKQVDKYYTNYTLSDKQLKLITEYIINILNDNNHPLQRYFHIAISHNIIDTGWGEDIHLSIFAGEILQNIFRGFNILMLHSIDEKMIITKTRDKKKINQAIELLLGYSDNVHLEYYLNKIKEDVSVVSLTTIYSSLFYHYTQIFMHNFKMNKSQATKLSSEILFYVFDCSVEHRISNKTKSYIYKDFTLTKYIY